MKELLNKYLHRKYDIHLGGLQVSIVVMDIKNSYGKVRFLVSPVTGKGEVWVESIIGVTI